MLQRYFINRESIKGNKMQSAAFHYAKVYLIFLLAIYSVCLFSQKQVYVSVFHFSDHNKFLFEEEHSFISDSIKVHQVVSAHVLSLASAGYIHANLDSIICEQDSCRVFVYKGEKWTIGKFNLTNEQKTILESGGFKKNKIEGNSPDSLFLYKYLNTIVNHHANQGYPFTLAKFDSVEIINGKLNIMMKVEKGKLILFDTIISEGILVPDNSFLKRFLDIRSGELYSHAKITGAKSRLNDLQYIKQRVDPYVRFVNDKATLILTLDPKPASRFDFLIGVLPQIRDGIRKWNLIVDFTAELNNNFNKGEYIFMQVKALKPENREIQIKSTLPYFAGLPIGSHVDFRLFKNANQNLDLYFDGGIQYLFGGFNNIKLYGSYRSSALLEVNSPQIISSQKLPERLDVSYSGVGVGLNFRQLDYRFNPTKGYSAEINVILGKKRILPNRQIIDLAGFENSYDTLQLNTLQGEADISASYYIPVGNWATIKSGVNAGIRYNQQTLRPNELMRIGGNKLLRGFDEESILTDMYTFGTLEFRILFDQNSYFSLPFIDAGFTNVSVNGVQKYDPVFGIGMGLNFGTPAGIFNLSFAAGKNLSNPLDFGKMKIHFGYVNLF